MEEGGCLVHCQAGVSRSASFIIAFVMKRIKCSLEQAYTFVKQRRPMVFPNFGFQHQLKKLEIQIGLISPQEYAEQVKGKTVLVK